MRVIKVRNIRKCKEKAKNREDKERCKIKGKVNSKQQKKSRKRCGGVQIGLSW
jgi:hypothetical protein